MLQPIDADLINRWRRPTPTVVPPRLGVLGYAASGCDLNLAFIVRLQQSQADTAGGYALQSAALPAARLRPENQRALALLDEWLAGPDPLGEEWWDAFEHDLEQHRFAIDDPE
jgi:hypothetical protein